MDRYNKAEHLKIIQGNINRKIDARIAALENARLDTASKDDIKELAQSIRETNKEIGEIGGKLAELVGELRANRNG